MSVNKRLKLIVAGRVQGVGFRPAVYSLARSMSLRGFVLNSPSGVLIEVEGESGLLEDFIEALKKSPPERSEIHNIEASEIPVGDDLDFRIKSSERSGDLTVGMPPDFATCPDCLKELFEKTDRRYRYPFINCTNCGPRFTIIDSLPYDRERTSMAGFRMCDFCSGEYHDPANRRFDAQPVACPACGPSVEYRTVSSSSVYGEEAVGLAVKSLKEGNILALKGLGGYHICCDAMNAKTVLELRRRKRRPSRALAVMFKDMDQLKKHCFVNSDEEKELTGAASPIVILKRKEDSVLPPAVSPDTNDIGAFLPYTPLHHLILRDIGPLIMTSGNMRDEPIARNEEEIAPMLGKIADALLSHNRPILRRCDDSVLKVVEGEKLFYRRSRGYVPSTLDVSFLTRGGAMPSVLACGAELKNTFCITRGDKVFMSQHIGDLSDYANYRFYQESVPDLAGLLGVSPEIIVHDAHPDYFSTRYALEHERGKRVSVQHHHAHIAACMLENGIIEPVIGVALDGTGLGDDGKIWGGEIFTADLKGYQRRFHFKEYRLPGGDSAVINPDRVALSCLFSEFGNDENLFDEILPSVKNETRSVLLRMIETGTNAPLSSSAGRLFDAVSAILGLCETISYEGQGAIRLQKAADVSGAEPYDFRICPEILDFGPMIKEIVSDIRQGKNVSDIAGRFHVTMAEAVCRAVARVKDDSGLKRVVLSGGVFQNELLLILVRNRLRAVGFDVYSHFLFPPNDACIALGQAGVALAREGN